MHQAEDGTVSVRVFWPGAGDLQRGRRARPAKQAAALELIHPAGFFAGPVPRRKKPFAYRLDLWDGRNGAWQAEDPYRFPPLLGELDIHLLGEGTHRRLYERLGAHPTTIDGVDGVAFAVWAPNAQRVSVVGDFNHWDGRRHPMRKRVEAGVWELFIPGVADGALYKYELLGARRAAPAAEGRPGRLPPPSCRRRPPRGSSASSATTGATATGWQARREQQARDAPISIYEVHLGSWRRKNGVEFLTYDELGDTLIPYAADMGFTHLELLPVTEHPLRRLLGLPADRPLRADQPLRLAGGLRPLRRPLPRGRASA